MNKKRNRLPATKVIIGLVLLIIVAAVGFVVLQQHQNKILSASQINKKFDCNPAGELATDLYKPTRVFCQNPKFYNDPDSVTAGDYYKYYACQERLKAVPPAESAKQSDPGFYDAYYNCKDPTKLDNLRQDFIKELKKLKSENS